jgi:hypothetical protein
MTTFAGNHYGTLSGECPSPGISWSFEQPATVAIYPILQPTYFYCTGRTRRWERFGYSLEDARSLIEYLNSRE